MSMGSVAHEAWFEIAGHIKTDWEDLPKKARDGWVAAAAAVHAALEDGGALARSIAPEVSLGSFEFQFPLGLGRVTARVQAPDFDSALRMMGSAGKAVTTEEKPCAR